MQNETAAQKVQRLKDSISANTDNYKPELLEEMNRLVGQVRHLYRCQGKN